MKFDIILNSNLEKTEIVEFYKTLLQNQSANFSTTIGNLSTNFSTLMYSLIGITILLMGSTWFWNFTLAKKQIDIGINKQVSKMEIILKKKYDQYLKKEVNKIEAKFENKLYYSEANSARLFAAQNVINKNYRTGVTWMATALDYYIKANDKTTDIVEIRVMIDEILKTLNKPNFNERGI